MTLARASNTNKSPHYLSTLITTPSLEPPLLGTPAPTYTPYATPEFHQSAENWKPAATHATLIKEPVVPVRAAPPTFVPQAQTQVSHLIYCLPYNFPLLH